MKTLQSVFVLLLALFASHSYAETPTETLKKTVNELIQVVADKSKSDEVMKQGIANVVHEAVDFDVVAQRVVSKPWQDTNEKQQAEFKSLFSDIMVDTYFDLLKNYNNETVGYDQEQVKKDKYAIVDTTVVSGDKKIPVRYRMINQDGAWKIYDFVVEGVSLVNSYKTNYQTIIKKDGFDALLSNMRDSRTKREQADNS